MNPDVLACVFAFCDKKTKRNLIRAYRKELWLSSALFVAIEEELDIEIPKKLNCANLYFYYKKPSKLALSRLFKHSNSKSCIKGLVRVMSLKYRKKYLTIALEYLCQDKRCKDLKLFLHYCRKFVIWKEARLEILLLSIMESLALTNKSITCYEYIVNYLSKVYAKKKFGVKTENVLNLQKMFYWKSVYPKYLTLLCRKNILNDEFYIDAAIYSGNCVALEAIISSWKQEGKPQHWYSDLLTRLFFDSSGRRTINDKIAKVILDNITNQCLEKLMKDAFYQPDNQILGAVYRLKYRNGFSDISFGNVVVDLVENNGSVLEEIEIRTSLLFLTLKDFDLDKLSIDARKVVEKYFGK